MGEQNSAMNQLTIAAARIKNEMTNGREFDDENATFRVGDVRALLDEIERMQTEFAYFSKLAAEDHDMLQRQCDRYEAHIMALEERIRKAHVALGITGGEIG